MTQTPNLGLDYLVQGQANAETTLNSNVFNYLDAFLSGREAEAEQDAPPGSPATGAVYLVGSSPSGDWASQAGNVAFYFAGWHFLPKKAGFRLFIKDVGVLKIYNGTDWVKQPVLAANDALEVVTRLLTSIETGITADSNGDQSNATQLDADKVTHVVATVGATNYAVKLPSANQKELHLVVNHGANDLQVFPSSGESIERLATDAATVIPPGKTALFIATASDNWGISLGGSGAGGITTSSFSEIGELLVGAGASSFSVLPVPASIPEGRILTTAIDKSLSWARPGRTHAYSKTTGSGTISADSKTWLDFTVSYDKSAIAFNASTGRFEFDATTYPELVGRWRMSGYFLIDTSEGYTVQVAAQFFAGAGGLTWTKLGSAIAALTADATQTIPIEVEFDVSTGLTAQVGLENEAGNAPHGGSFRNLYNRIFFEKCPPY